MFSRLSTASFYLLIAFTILVAANPTTTVTVTAQPSPTPIPASQCNTGNIQCCNSVQSASSSTASLLLVLLGIVLSNPNVLVGITCSPLTIVGGGNSCTAQPVCCTNNNFNGVVAIGCTPINVNL